MIPASALYPLEWHAGLEEDNCAGELGSCRRRRTAGRRRVLLSTVPSSAKLRWKDVLGLVDEYRGLPHHRLLALLAEVLALRQGGADEKRLTLSDGA